VVLALPPSKDAHGVVTISSPELSSLASSEDESLGDQVADEDRVSTSLFRPAQSKDELGRLGHYRILKELGRGGMGAVFLAEDVRLLRNVALKILLPKYASNAKSKERFLREARTAASIENDHIIAIHEVDEDNGVPFLTMPVLKGESLQDRLDRDTSLSVAEVLRVGSQICQGLQAAHERSLVHRDLKPSNLWLEGVRGRVKILDFGLARAVHTDQQLTQSGAIVGTPAYMAPEQARSPKMDGRADLFSLGVVLYRCLVGQAPFTGHDAMSVMLAICNDMPLPPGERIAGIPTELNGLIIKLLAKDPDRRFASAEEVGLALEAIEHFVGQGTSGGSLTPAPIAQPITMSGVGSNVILLPSSSEQPSPKVITKSPRFRWPTVVVVLGTGLISMVAAIVYWQMGERSQRTDIKEPFVQANGTNGPDKPEVKPPAILEPEADDDRPFTHEPDGPDPMRPLPPWDLPAGAPKPAVFPFDPTEATVHQVGWAEYLKKPLTFENKLSMKFVLIPPGEFEMVFYSGPQQTPDAVKRRTRLTEGFYLGTTHVTVEHFEMFVKATSYKTEAELGEGGAAPPNWEYRPKYTWRQPWDYPVNPKHPVTQVTRSDALAFCAWLSKREKATYRLATEAERIFAGRAGNTSKYGVSDDSKDLEDYQWLKPWTSLDEYRVRPVGTKKPNPFGIFDSNGNAHWMLFHTTESGFRIV
jgi:serine/threonine protein kinase